MVNQDSNPVSGGWPVSSFGLVLASTALALVMVLGAGRGARAQDEPEFDPFDFTTPAPDEEPAEGEAAAPGAVDPATPEFPAIPG